MTTALMTPAAQLACEADMLEPLRQMCETLRPSSDLGHDAFTLFEVPTMRGVADLIRCTIDPQELCAREHSGRAPIPDRRLVRTVQDLLRLGRADAGTLALAGRVSDRRMRAHILPVLTEAGWITDVGEGWYEALDDPGHPVVNLTVIEAKLSNVTRGTYQALGYRACADAAYLALATPARCASIAARVAAYGLGFISVDARHAHVIQPAPSNPDSDPWSRAVLAETVLMMLADGRRSGPARDVFGRALLATGLDPRWANA